MTEIKTETIIDQQRLEPTGALLLPEGAASLARLPRPAGWLHFESGWLSPGQALGNLETAVSLIQSISAGLTEIGDLLSGTITQLHAVWVKGDKSGPPSSEVMAFFCRNMEQIDEIVRNSRFHGRGLINGQSGLVGIGQGVDFVRGGPGTVNSPPAGFEIRILGFPTRAALEGGVTVHEDWLKMEQEIFLAEGERFVRFNPEGTINITDFLKQLQEAIRLAGLDLEVGLSRQRRLIIRHNQYGSHYKFKGSSRGTPLLSKRPGKIEWSRKGRDIQGTMDSEPAFGVGRMLVGFLDNKRTSELAVIWRGNDLEDGRIARCHVIQNGFVFQDGSGPDRHIRRISLPSFHTQALGRWVEGQSGFTSLAEAKIESWQELADTLQMLFAVSCEVDEWKERTTNWINQYQNLALELLRKSAPMPEMIPQPPPSGQRREVNQMAEVMRRLIQNNQA